MENLDEKQLKFFRQRRLATTMKPMEYGRFLYLKHKEKFDKILDDSDFEIPADEREKVFGRLYHQFWLKIGYAITEQIEVSWGMKYKHARRTLEHPFYIHYKKLNHGRETRK